MLADPGNEFANINPWCNALKCAADFNGWAKFTAGHFTGLNDDRKQQNQDLLAPGTMQLL